MMSTGLGRRSSLALLLVLGLAHVRADAPPSAEELGRKREELVELRSRVQDLRLGLTEVRGKRAELTEELAESERRIGNIARELHRLDEQLGEKQAKLDDESEALKSQLRTAYAMGRQERLRILLNQLDPALISRMMVYYDYFNRSRLKRMARIREDIDLLRRLEEEILVERQALEVLHSRHELERENLLGAQAEREGVLATLDAEIADKGQRLADLELDEERMARFLSDLQRMLDEMALESLNQADFSDLRGKLPWPSKGRLAVAFGEPRKRSNRRWDGVIIDAPEGQEVYAVHHGRVAFADWLRGFGLLLILDHGDGYLSLYGHNQTLFKETGDWVEAGEPVGLVGRSGGRTNPGVYFAIRKQTKPLDPRAWCTPARGNRVG
jgi:septal ring factor EnvC (AmiA/AmiB activator)